MEEMKAAHIWILLSTAVLVSIASFYVFYLVIINKQTRYDFFYVTICLFSILYGVGAFVETVLLERYPHAEIPIDTMDMLATFGITESHWLF